MRSFPIMSFKARMVAAICVVNILVILIISTLSSLWYYNQIVSQTMEQTQQVIEQVGANVETYMNELYRLTLSPYYNDEVMAELEKTPADAQAQLASKRVVEGFLSSVMTLPRSEILRVYIMSEGGSLYSYTRTPYEMADINTYQDSEWYSEAHETTKPILITPRLERVYGEKRTPVFSVVRQLRNKENNHITCGVIKVDADYTGIRKICEKVSMKAGSVLLIANEEDQLLYQSGSLPDGLSVSQLNTNLSNIKIESNEKYLVNTHNLSTYGMRIIALHSYDELMRPLWENLLRTVALAVSCIVIAAVFFVCIIRKFLKPLFEIIGLMRKVEQGDLQVKAQTVTHDEMGYLADSFNHMVANLDTTMKRNEQLVREVYQAQYLTKEAQYDSLCSQIKPHFLYNTLNTISLLIKCDEGAAAVRTIEALSQYLGGIMNVDHEITVKQELQICEAYLSIVHLRYQDRLTYVIDIDDSLLMQAIPSLSLQSLVENAVKYACEPKRGKTTISITSHIEVDSYFLTVKDDGSGMDPAKLQAIQASLHDMDDCAGYDDNRALLGNVGLLNLYQRLRLKFGGKANLIIKSEAGIGTEVTICLPRASAREEENHV